MQRPAAASIPASTEEPRADELIGRRLEELPTPALVLDIEAADRNIARMAEFLSAGSVALRPHIKAHKCPELALRQCQAGAIGVTAATAEEAVVMASAGVGEVLLANQVVVPAKLDLVARAAREQTMIVAVDAPEQLRLISRAAANADSRIGVVIEVDVGMGRCGTRNPDDALRLASSIEGFDGLSFRGVMGYEGQCVDDPERPSREKRAAESIAKLGEVVDVLDRDGLRCEIVSAGGTGTYDITSAIEPVTEIQAGSYVLMDRYHGAITPEFEPALSVAATVISVHGELVVCDAGRKALGGDLARPHLNVETSEFAFLNEEHSGFTVQGSRPAIGERVSIIPSYAPTAVNLYPAYAVVREGVLVEEWRIRGRYWDL
jgi:D-serine deaminase-like pyridoxal phosphate-dependent protein